MSSIVSQILELSRPTDTVANHVGHQASVEAADDILHLRCSRVSAVQSCLLRNGPHNTKAAAWSGLFILFDLQSRLDDIEGVNHQGGHYASSETGNGLTRGMMCQLRVLDFQCLACIQTKPAKRKKNVSAIAGLGTRTAGAERVPVRVKDTVLSCHWDALVMTVSRVDILSNQLGQEHGASDFTIYSRATVVEHFLPLNHLGNQSAWSYTSVQLVLRHASPA
ncbi:hypothetical protein KC328_g71 [Hortaea werneckii]|nr:hypothetical protein KC328_g71 [Hortaea werneckii]